MKPLIIAAMCMLLLAAMASAYSGFDPLLEINQCISPDDGNIIVLAYSGNSHTINNVEWSLDGDVQGTVDLPGMAGFTKHRVFLGVSAPSVWAELSCHDGSCTSPDGSVDDKETYLFLTSNDGLCNSDEMAAYNEANQPVPEFGVVAASIAMIGAVAGILIMRRR